MKNQNPKNKLRDLIVNNPRAQQRKAMKEIEKHVKSSHRFFASKSEFEHSLW